MTMFELQLSSTFLFYNGFIEWPIALLDRFNCRPFIKIAEKFLFRAQCSLPDIRNCNYFFDNFENKEHIGDHISTHIYHSLKS